MNKKIQCSYQCFVVGCSYIERGGLVVEGDIIGSLFELWMLSYIIEENGAKTKQL